MSIKEDVFKMLDQGQELDDIVLKLNINANTAVTYKNEWKCERGIKPTPAKSADELANSLFGEDKPKKKTFVARGQEAPKPSMLKLESEIKVYKGKFGKYTITDGVVDIELNKETLTAMEKPNLIDLTIEISELGGLM